MHLIRRHSKEYNFIGDAQTGVTMRWGRTLRDNPHMAPIPELIDISVSNHCTKGCIFCYRDSLPNNKFMSLKDYEFVLKSVYDNKWGNVFQVALGGGEPLEHPDIIEILKITRKYGVVPNFTTNALHASNRIASQIKPLVGAVAISYQNIDAITSSNASVFIEEGVKTNIHYLLNRKNIYQGIEILEGKYNELLDGFNSIVFLTYKPMGRGTGDLCLELNNSLSRFCALIQTQNCMINVGVDSCFMPSLMHFTNTNINFIEPCECAFFSAYIDEDLNVKPCSFANNDNATYSLRENPFKEIWNSLWDEYRSSQVNSCNRDCKNSTNCRGGCPYFSQINLCKTDVPAESLV